jgi:hypothetical protein
MNFEPGDLNTIPKDRFSQRVARVKALFDRQPDVKHRVLEMWRNERPDLGSLKTDQLLVRIAIDYLKKWEDWKKESHGEMPVQVYENSLHRDGCPIPKRADKRVKYDQAMAQREQVSFYDDDDTPPRYESPVRKRVPFDMTKRRSEFHF